MDHFPPESAKCPSWFLGTDHLFSVPVVNPSQPSPMIFALCGPSPFAHSKPLRRQRWNLPIPVFLALTQWLVPVKWPKGSADGLPLGESRKWQIALKFVSPGVFQTVTWAEGTVARRTRCQLPAQWSVLTNCTLNEPVVLGGSRLGGVWWGASGKDGEASGQAMAVRCLACFWTKRDRGPAAPAPGAPTSVSCVGRLVAETCACSAAQRRGKFGLPNFLRRGGSPVLREVSLARFRSDHSSLYQGHLAGSKRTMFQSGGIYRDKAGLLRAA